MKITTVNVSRPPRVNNGLPNDNELPGDNSGLASDNGLTKVAILFQGIYSILGLLVGVIFLVGGLILLLSGIGGSSHFVAEILGAKFDLSDATAGVICAVLGFIVIFVTRFEIRIQGK
jgi:hypothetical protein